jgi:head-tail adaptor
MTGVNIGEFEEIVDLYDCITTKDPRGAKVEQYDWCCRQMAKVEVGATETDADFNVFSADTITITMYKVCSLTTRWRVRWHDGMYNIRSVDLGERMSPFMRLTAEEVI